MLTDLLARPLTYLVALALVVTLGYCAGQHLADRMWRGSVESRDSVLADLEAERERLTREVDVARRRLLVERDTLTIRTTRYRLLRDTLRLTDTVRVAEALVASEAALSACELLAANCWRLVETEDSALRLEGERARLLEEERGRLTRELGARAWLGRREGFLFGVAAAGLGCALVR